MTDNYNITFIANDTDNNRNTTEATNFTVIDTNSLVITSLSCIPASANISGTLRCNATITDDIAVSVVSVNVTYPNGTNFTQTVTNFSSNYSFTFTDSVLIGNYTVSWLANDTSNNQRTANDSFFVNDSVRPIIYLTSPTNRSNETSSLTFTFNVSENFHSSLNCSLFINGTLDQTDENVLNGTATSLNVNNLLDGDHNWNVTCTDGQTNFNTSITRIFTVDAQVPTFGILSTSPNTEADLDPNVNITVKANVTDNLTSIETVILQYKLSTDSTFTNVTMDYNGGDQLYNASFNATSSGVYSLKLFANDTVGNNDLSSEVNITVGLDKNWTRTPATFSVVTASLNNNVSIGNLTVNNSGDFALEFTVTSDSNDTTYNDSTTFNLTSGQVMHLFVSDNATVSGIKTVTLNISVNDSDAVPTELVTTGSIVSSVGQPILSSSFTTPSGDTLSVTQGDTNVEFISLLENIGENDAFNVSFFFTIPEDWTITFGGLSTDLEELVSGDSEENSIEVTIPSDFAAGNYNVFVNSTGINSSGYNLSDANLTFGDMLTVTVEEAATELVGGGGAVSAPAAAPAAAAAAAGGGGDTSRKAVGATTDTIETTEIFRVVRGSVESTPLKITNLYQNTFMQDIKLDVLGFLSQYVVLSTPIDYGTLKKLTLKRDESQFFLFKETEKHSITIDKLTDEVVQLTVQSTPQELLLKKGKLRFIDLDGDKFGDIALEFKDSIEEEAEIEIYELQDLTHKNVGYGGQLDFALDIHAPSYLTRSDYNLTLEISAELIPYDAELAGFERKSISEVRTLLFRVHEVGEEDASDGLDQAKKDIQEMVDAEFNTIEVKELFSLAELAFEAADYELTIELTDKISTIKKEAFTADRIIKEIQESLRKSNEKWLDAPQTEENLELTLVAFNRGDYSTALERAKKTQLIYVLETKGKINIIRFVIDWWWALILGLLFASVSGYFIYKKSIVLIIDLRLKNLLKEEESIHILMKEAQKKYIVEKSLTKGQYTRFLKQYEKRLAEIKQLEAKLRNKRVSILKTEQEIKNSETNTSNKT